MERLLLSATKVSEKSWVSSARSMAAMAINAAEQDEGRVDLAPPDRRRPAPGQPGGHHGHPDQRGDEPEEDPGVAEGPVHRSGPAVPVRNDRAFIAWCRRGR